MLNLTRTPEASNRPAFIDGRGYLALGLAWFLGAVCLGATGVVASMGPPMPQIVLVLLTALLLLAAWLQVGFRAWLATIPMRCFVGLHLFRFVGIYFLMLHHRGQLPYAFAVPGGWGDILVASGAAILLASGRLENRMRLLGVWNVVGLLDILFVVSTAARLAMANPASMNALGKLPLSLLPTFLVPLIIGSHVLIFWRLRKLRCGS